MAFNRESLELFSMILNKDKQSDEASKQRAYESRMQQNQMLHQNYQNRVNRISNEIAQSRQSLDAMKNAAVEIGLEFGSDSDFESLRTDYSGSLENQIMSGQENINNMRQISEQIRSRLSTARAASEISSKFSESNRYMQSLLGEGDMSPDDAVEELIREYGLNENAYSGNSQDASEEQRMQFREDLKRGFIQGLSDPLSRQQERNAAAQEELARQQRVESATNMRAQQRMLENENAGQPLDPNELVEWSFRNFTEKLNLGFIKDFALIRQNADPETGEVDEASLEEIRNVTNEYALGIVESIEDVFGFEFGDRDRVMNVFSEVFQKSLDSSTDIQFATMTGTRLSNEFDRYEENKQEEESFPEFIMREINESGNIDNIQTLAYIAAFGSNPAISIDREASADLIASGISSAMHISDLMDYDISSRAAGEGETTGEATIRYNQGLQDLDALRKERKQKILESLGGLDYIADAYDRMHGERSGLNLDADTFRSEIEREREKQVSTHIETGENLNKSELAAFSARNARDVITEFENYLGRIERTITNRDSITESQRREWISDLNRMVETSNAIEEEFEKDISNVDLSPSGHYTGVGAHAVNVAQTRNIHSMARKRSEILELIERLNSMSQ